MLVRRSLFFSWMTVIPNNKRVDIRFFTKREDFITFYLSLFSWILINIMIIGSSMYFSSPRKKESWESSGRNKVNQLKSNSE